MRPRHKLIDALYLLGQLRRLAEWDAASGRWMLTTASACPRQR
ncbi:MAG: hypothetical protein U0470_08050 [Anaerolineae bacterium]